MPKNNIVLSKDIVSNLMSKINFKLTINGKRLIPAIVQDHKTNDVLMLGFMDGKALIKTLTTGKIHFWSRDRQKLWLKGEKSGHHQYLKEFQIDCDQDTLLFKVDQVGGACHNGYKSCFYQKYADGKFKVFRKRIFNPKEVYERKK